MHLQDTKGQRDSQTNHTSIEIKHLKKTVILKQAQKDKEMQKNMALIANWPNRILVENGYDERDALATFIANLKADDRRQKKDSKAIKESNATLTQELTDCKSILSLRRKLVELKEKSNKISRDNEITELQCLYLHKVMECDCLAQKLSEQTDFVSKEIYTELLQRFARLEKHSISLEIALTTECQVTLKKTTVCTEKVVQCISKRTEQYVEIQDLKAQMQDKNMAISELKKLVAKCKGKSVDTKFDKPSVVRQPNAQRLPKPSVLGKPAPFSNSLERDQYIAKKKSFFKNNDSDEFNKPVTLQNARTKKPNVVPISTRKPKRQANKSVATPHKKTVASESTTTSSKSYYRMLYQKTSKGV
ncbi:hypothetical protein Tco_1143900 [Tanacetum coccineum]